MGISPGWFDQVMFTPARRGYLKNGASFLDIGASELFCAQQPESINDFIRFFGGEPWSEVDLQIAANRSFARATFERAGFKYAAIDYADYDHIIRMNLNLDRLPWRHRGKYDFVANTGTSEHILNQYNVFKIIHDATAVGGIMYHGVPFLGTFEHGIIQYTPKFMWALATDNDYEIVSAVAVISDESMPLREDFVQKLSMPNAPLIQETWMHFMLRKRYDRKFQGANDPGFSPAATEENPTWAGAA